VARQTVVVLVALGGLFVGVVVERLGMSLGVAVACALATYAAAGLTYWRHVKPRPKVRFTPRFDGRFFADPPRLAGPLQAALAEAEAEATRQKQTNERIVDALLECYRYGTHEVRNKLRPGLRDEALAAWITHRSMWEHSTKEKMQELGCSNAEVSSFWEYTAHDLAAVGVAFPDRVGPHNQLSQGVQFRLKALKRIINQRSGRDVFPNV
jgi:hypothetical protein